MSDYYEYLKRPAKLGLAKKLGVLVWVLTAAVLVLVGMMRRYKVDVGVDFSFLPPVHAVLNTIVALCLVLALWRIKKQDVKGHKVAILFAMLASVLFLLCYVAYHFTTPETLFGDVNGDFIVSDAEKEAAGSLRNVYFVVLISHIVLAGVSLPFILFTWLFGFTNQFRKHRKLARWVFPVWLFVAVTGPICYLMLLPYY